MTSPVKHTLADLTGFQPRHDTFVGIDSDGCVFDTMEIKQKQCFHGLIISYWKLEPIEQPLRQAAEFVNLYSKHRGQNRFLALLKMFELLADHPEVRLRGFALPSVEGLRRFIASGKLTESGLQEMVEQSGDAELKLLLAWTRDVNAAIASKVKRIPPFHWAHKSLARIHAHSDAACVSQTPTEALVREWEENEIDHLIDLIAGQELGTKSEHLALATKGRYPAERVLMIGDAQGDYKAAEANGACFFPINPAHEEASWQRFFEEGYDHFRAGTFLGAYQRALVGEFNALLPETPPWAHA